MYLDTGDPYGGGYGGGGGGGSGGGGTGEDTGITGGTDPNQHPVFKPGPHGWWEFFQGVWHWMTEPVPRVMQAG